MPNEEEIEEIKNRLTILEESRFPRREEVLEIQDVLLNHRHTDIDRTFSVDKVLMITTTVPGTQAATATNYGKFFEAMLPYSILEISEVHAALGSDAGAVTLNIERLQGTEALDAGDLLLSTAFDLKASINVVRTGVLVGTNVINLNIGDRLALKDSGTLTAVDDVLVMIKLIQINA